MDIVQAGSRLDRLLQNSVLDHCERLARKSELLFVICFASIGVISSSAVDFGLSRFGLNDYETPALLTRGAGILFFMTLVFAPLFETLLLQQVPMSLARRFGMTRLTQFLIGSVPFAAMHFNTGLVSGIAGGVVGGLVLSLAYLTYLSHSKAKAFIITAAIHSLCNLAPTIMIARDLP